MECQEPPVIDGWHAGQSQANYPVLDMWFLSMLRNISSIAARLQAKLATSHRLDGKFLTFLKKADWPSTTEDIAAEVKISWNTAQVHLLKMLHEGIVKYKKVGRQNQFWLNEGYEKYFKGKNKK